MKACLRGYDVDQRDIAWYTISPVGLEVLRESIEDLLDRVRLGPPGRGELFGASFNRTSRHSLCMAESSHFRIVSYRSKQYKFLFGHHGH